LTDYRALFIEYRALLIECKALLTEMHPQEALVHHGEPIIDRKSTFQAHFATCLSHDDVRLFVSVLNRYVSFHATDRALLALWMGLFCVIDNALSRAYR